MNESAFVPYSESDYKKLTRLGNGDFGVVWKIQLQASGEYCAIEYISERNREKALHDLKAKAHILHLVSSPYIIRMIGFQFQEPYALLTEYCPGGNPPKFSDQP